MNKEELKKKFLDAFLVIPTEKQVTPAEMKAMENLSEVFSNFPPEKAEAMLLACEMLASSPDEFAKLMKLHGSPQSDLDAIQDNAELLDSSRRAEQNRAN